MTELVKQSTGEQIAPAERTQDKPLFTPRFDIFENDNELVLYGDLPGVSQQDLDIRFESNILEIHGQVEPRNNDRQTVYSEYGIGDFYRTFAIGESVDTEKISAELKNGVLTLHLPKTEEVKPRKIEVKSA